MWINSSSKEQKENMERRRRKQKWTYDLIPGSFSRSVPRGYPPTSWVSRPKKCPTPCGMKSAPTWWATISATSPCRNPRLVSSSKMVRSAARQDSKVSAGQINTNMYLCKMELLVRPNTTCKTVHILPAHPRSYNLETSLLRSMHCLVDVPLILGKFTAHRVGFCDIWS